MLSSKAFAVVTAITFSSGGGAVALVVVGRTLKASSRREVARQLAQIAVVGAMAIWPSS